MTKTQARIVELVAQLSPEERRELIEHMQQAGLLDDTYYGRLSVDQRAQLDEGIAQADRGEVVDGGEAFERLAKRFNFKRT